MRSISILLGILTLYSPILAKDVIWQNNKITQDQPFPAKVLAVEASWGGYRLLLQGIGDDSEFCIAQIWPGAGGPVGQLSYKAVEREDFPEPSPQWVFVEPAIEVDRFSWSIGPWKIGRIFGDQDCLKIVLSRSRTNREQGDDAN